MTDAPERIWLDCDAEGDGQHTRCFGNPKYCSEPAIEYIRADIVAKAIVHLEEKLDAENWKLREALEDKIDE